VAQLRQLFIGFLLILWPLVAESADIPARLGLRTYSDMNFNKLEGEFYGLQVVIVPYSGGQKILWRSGGGKLDPPLLLDAVKEGNGWKIVVPENSDFFGEWTLSFDRKTLRAIGPRGLQFDLKEVTR
jgi:hypothetical protein